MQIEAGKFYKTHDGRKVGPMSLNANKWVDESTCQFDADDKRWDGSPQLWNDDGSVYMARGSDKVDTLVAEWQDEPTGPVRTVTRREIVPGDYGRVRVGSEYGTGNLWVEIIEDRSAGLILNANELRSAAIILSQLAEALDDNKDAGK